MQHLYRSRFLYFYINIDMYIYIHIFVYTIYIYICVHTQHMYLHTYMYINILMNTLEIKGTFYTIFSTLGYYRRLFKISKNSQQDRETPNLRDRVHGKFRKFCLFVGGFLSHQSISANTEKKILDLKCLGHFWWSKKRYFPY